MNQSLARETTDDLIQIIQGTFYREVDRGVFYSDLNSLIHAITWPANWLKQHDLRMTANQYRTFILDRLGEIIIQGKQKSVMTSFPNKLLESIKEYIRRHGNELYNLLKRAGRAFKTAFADISQNPENSDHTVDILAQTHHFSHPDISLQRLSCLNFGSRIQAYFLYYSCSGNERARRARPTTKSNLLTRISPRSAARQSAVECVWLSPLILRNKGTKPDAFLELIVPRNNNDPSRGDCESLAIQVAVDSDCFAWRNGDIFVDDAVFQARSLSDTRPVKQY